MLSVFMVNVIMLSFVMLNVIMLSVLGPFTDLKVKAHLSVSVHFLKASSPSKKISCSVGWLN
jgi:hypothetical protein